MAEINLGRIKFIWKGDWTASTLYYKDDIVRKGGNAYVCVSKHTSSSLFVTDLAGSWNKLSDGQQWKNDWTVSTYYNENDVVKYGGLLYIATTAHTSTSDATVGLPADISNWNVYAEAFSYKGNWTTNYTYAKNEIVQYNGIVYLCVTAHTSATSTVLGLEADQSKWTVFSNGLYWTGNWAVDTRYKVNDLVKYGGQIYVCNEAHTSASTDSLGLENDQSKWNFFHKGIEYKTDWQAGIRYKVNDLVKYGGGIWICVTYHTSQATFTADEAKWQQFVEGLQFEDTWTPTKHYQPGDIATYGGYNYVAKTFNSDKKPVDYNNDWDLFSTGFKFIGEWGEDSSNQHYDIGDVVSVGGYTYLCIQAHETNYKPPNATYWKQLNAGINWKNAWSNASIYVLGDAVSYNDSSYICILAHTSDQTTAQNRPDQTTGSGTGQNHWKILAGGAENNALTTKGDLLYYSGSGPARLPIGTKGQVLTVNDAGDLPEWSYINSINNVYYVESNNGVDSEWPLYGSSITLPWKTIAWASEQILAGPQFPNARYLLDLNRAFIQDESVEWTDTQISGASGIWLGFTYTKEDWRKDIGQLIDAISHDMGHGGNSHTRMRTQSYFSSGSLIASISGKSAQFVATVNYMVTVIDAVISNTAPGTVYGSVTRHTDNTKSEEATAQSRISSLAVILTDALTAQSNSNVPTEYKPNNTLFVKTGKYEEICPVIIAENTALVGDELRSTKIVAKGSVIDTIDATYSLQSVTRLKNIISDIITKTSVTKSTSNSESQITTGVAGSLGNGTALTSIDNNADEIVDILDNGVANANAIVFSDQNDNTPAVIAKKYSRELLQLNRAFILSELNTWITNQIANNTSPFTSGFTYDSSLWQTNFGYAIDALSYDVQYDSRWATVISARLYFNKGLVAAFASGETAELSAAYYQLGSICSNIIVNQVSGQSTTGVAGVGTSVEQGQCNQYMQSIGITLTDGIGSLPTITFPNISWTSAANQGSHAAILLEKTNIQSQTIGQIKAANPTLEFNETTCSRDSGYMIDALAYDMALGTNYQSIISGISYHRGTASANKVLNDQKTATLNAIKFIKEKTRIIALNGPGEKAKEIVQKIYQYIDNKINSSGTVPFMHGSNDPLTDTNHTYALEAIELNRKFIKAEIVAYNTDTFTSTATATAASGNIITAASTSWLAVNTPIKFTGTTFGNLVAGTTYYVKSVPNSTTFTIGVSKTDATILTLADGTGSVTFDLVFDSILLAKQFDKYINAIKHDLIYTGIYETQKAAEYYTNSVKGSKLSNLFLCRNGTGIRGCTLEGLDGRSDGTTINTGISGLSSANSFGTKRPLAGAYVSLDPGWNPEHKDCWIATKSPYIQGVSTFGTGCIGLKVDGYLHAGGNDSIVANDFTQILSDGIGYWVSNLGRSELVSVFTYYNHIGYLSENGGKIRSTNGNNSYGEHGSVAEGVDVTEVAVTGKVDNRAFEATVQNVITDGNEIRLLEYANAGQSYTAGATTISISGEGFGVAQTAAVVATGGVYEVRMLETGNNFGGENYKHISNTAQGGTTTSITLSNTDDSQQSQIIGMRVFITTGKGTAQYGYIHSYNNGTKVAEIYKESDGTAGWDSAAGLSIEPFLDATTAYSIEPRVIFDASNTYPSDYTKRAKARAEVITGEIVRVNIWDPGEGYTSAPSVTFTDPNNTGTDAPVEVRYGNGVLKQPVYTNRGTNYQTASATVTGDGFMDTFQPGTLVQVKEMSEIPLPGSNIVFASMPTTYFKLVAVRSLSGSAGTYTAQFQISPALTITQAPAHEEAFTLRLRYSQVRLTGHDFLNVGTGNITTTNYPGTPTQDPDQADEIIESGGGRVFYTSTDQDGNFRVGELFSVEQSTGVATLNADAFNLSGLQELSLGELGLGTTGAVISEFSTDGTFTANSDSIVPTQKAIKTYIASQIGSGASQLNVNSITAGEIIINNNDISTTTDNGINVLQKMDFKKGVDGVPVALNFFLKA